MSEPDLWLAARLVELAETAAADTAAASAEQLTTILADLLGPAEVGLLLSDDAGNLSVSAASSGRTRNLASLLPWQHDDTLTQPLFSEPVGHVAERWPAFAAAAAAAGFGTFSVLPMRRQAQLIGILIVLGPGGRQLTAAELRSAEILARAGAITMSQQRELRETALAAAQLQRALDTRVLIEQAKGATAARLGITPDAAFALLRAHARRDSRTLAEVAQQTLSGELSAHDLMARRDRVKPAR